MRALLVISLLLSLTVQPARAEEHLSSARWYRLFTTADQGDATAQYQLALQFHFGQGVVHSLSRAYKWYSLAARQGHDTAVQGRDLLAGDMTTDERAFAEFLIRRWDETREPGEC